MDAASKTRGYGHFERKRALGTEQLVSGKKGRRNGEVGNGAACTEFHRHGGRGESVKRWVKSKMKWGW